MGSDEGGGFGDALEEADRHDVAWVMGGGCEHGECTPGDHHAWEEDAGFEVIEGEIGRDLADNISVECQHHALYLKTIRHLEYQIQRCEIDTPTAISSGEDSRPS